MIQVEQEQKPIINSPLWTDLYKITMGQGVFHRYPDVEAEYRFINRGRHNFPEDFGRKLREQIEMMADLSLSASDREFLEEKTPFLQQDYLDWFGDYRFDPEEVAIEQNGGKMDIRIKGPWMRTIYWEVPLMALICELYYQDTNQKPQFDYIEKTKAKGRAMKKAMAWFFEFGTRRAFSHEVHQNVLGALLETAGRVEDGGPLLGTSNVALAKEFDLNPGGTYAHEWVMGHAAMFGNLQANQQAMAIWAREYLGMGGGTAYPRLGTTLMDTFTTDVFLKDLNPAIFQYYTYLRQDSGEPMVEGEKAVRRLRKLGIDPMNKGVVFSDGLDIPRALQLNEHFKDQTKVTFGIGTDFTNDVGVRPMNIVIKAHSFAKEGTWIPVCKLSDDRGKESGDPKAIQKAKEDFGIL